MMVLVVNGKDSQWAHVIYPARWVKRRSCFRKNATGAFEPGGCPGTSLAGSGTGVLAGFFLLEAETRDPRTRQGSVKLLDCAEVAEVGQYAGRDIGCSFVSRYGALSSLSCWLSAPLIPAWCFEADSSAVPA